VEPDPVAVAFGHGDSLWRFLRLGRGKLRGEIADGDGFVDLADPCEDKPTPVAAQKVEYITEISVSGGRL